MSPFSLCINHCAAREDRKLNLQDMVLALSPIPPAFKLHDDPRLKPAGATKVVWALQQWDWARSQDVGHCVFMSDDLNIAPDFWDILTAMVTAKPTAIIGLLSNHPRAVSLAKSGRRWYRTNSWLVGPAYVIPKMYVGPIADWYRGLDAASHNRLNDDSGINEWISTMGPKECYHPLPTIIEHRHDIKTTWVEGDKYSRERVSWRALRKVVGDAPHRWESEAYNWPLRAMTDASYWDWEAPMMIVEGEPT